MYKSARPALNKASEAAEKAGQPHGILVTTTPRCGSYSSDIVEKSFFNCWKLLI